MVVPEQVRSELRGQSLFNSSIGARHCTPLKTAAIEHRVTVSMLTFVAGRIRLPPQQISFLDPELLASLREHPAAPALLAEPGVGPVVAAQLP
ncbi:hypothetical protein [Rhodococcus koreensis]|uniref:hypothetical protein n=1 Tax=Rhodococcus koreensis TaxID=99653 RepID=UPI00367087B8